MPTTIIPNALVFHDKPWNKPLKPVLNRLHLSQVQHQAEVYRQILLGNEPLDLKKAQRLNASIPNVRTQLEVIRIGQTQVPLTINETEWNNSYVCSPFTAYISYAKDELGLIQSFWQRQGLKIGIHFAETLLKLAEINHTVSINNWLFSTNLLPNWQTEELRQAQQQLITDYPQHSLCIRSLNRNHHAELINRLNDLGWQLIPARQVYLFDAQQRDWWKRNHTKKDQSLLRKLEAGKLPLTWVHPQDHQAEDFPEIERCFHRLFIEKHSHYNPQFTASFLLSLHQQKWIEFHSLRDENCKIVATIGLFTQQNTITSPIVGYDTSLPQKLGLYRLLMAILLRLTYERQQPINLSSGAGNFKRSRGGQPEIEYTAFYTKHLSKVRHGIHQQFAKYANRYGPNILQENEI